MIQKVFNKACFYFGMTLRNYCEASFYEMDDGVLHMMQRNRTELHPDPSDGLLAVTESVDEGDMVRAHDDELYPILAAGSQFGRMPEERFFGLSCPQPSV